MYLQITRHVTSHKYVFFFFWGGGGGRQYINIFQHVVLACDRTIQLIYGPNTISRSSLISWEDLAEVHSDSLSLV
jgi:hypothetical protein